MRERAPAIALLTALLLSAQCVISIVGIEVALECEPIGPPTSIDASGRSWELDRLALTDVRVVLVPCPEEPRASLDFYFWSAAPAHAHAGEPSIELHELDLLAAGTAGSLEPPPGAYCDLRIAPGAESTLQLDAHRSDGQLLALRISFDREGFFRIHGPTGAIERAVLDRSAPYATLVLTSDPSRIFAELAAPDREDPADAPRVVSNLLGALEVRRAR